MFFLVLFCFNEPKQCPESIFTKKKTLEYIKNRLILIKKKSIFDINNSVIKEEEVNIILHCIMCLTRKKGAYVEDEKRASSVSGR